MPLWKKKYVKENHTLLMNKELNKPICTEAQLKKNNFFNDPTNKNECIFMCKETNASLWEENVSGNIF